MDPFVIDEIIHHTLSICSYTKLILLSQLNLKYNKISKLFIGSYAKDEILNDLGVDNPHNCCYAFSSFLILSQYDHFISILRYNWKDCKSIKILGCEYQISKTGRCMMYRGSFDQFFKDYKILISYLRKL